MTYKIAVVGDKDSILPFKFVGFDIFPLDKPEELRALLKRLEDTYGIIYLTEPLAQNQEDLLNYYKNKTLPALILIPNYKGSLDLGKQHIQENVEKAIGSNIL